MDQLLLSVIVPNYNYAHFLKRRLDSIAKQTIKTDEIIFLDDCSADNSLEVAKQLLETYGIEYTIVTNKTNQGVFSQWLKGISLAKYDYIWIAEADDSCTSDLMDKLLPAFNDPDVVISYCQSQIINGSGQNPVKTHRDDIAKIIDASRWQKGYVNSCHDEASRYLCITSTIANASAVLLKKQALPLDKLQHVTEYKMAGDWLFYLLILFENPALKIAYCEEKLNLWYKHDTNIWADKTKAMAAYIECLKIYNIILSNYRVATNAKKSIY
jgi:glycosyltransferase involved in cell wall biosynthesis